VHYVCQKEISVNKPEKIDEEQVNVAQSDEMTTDELTEVEGVDLERVSGGPDGTAMGIA
jgi:hypothetical protein